MPTIQIEKRLLLCGSTSFLVDPKSKIPRPIDCQLFTRVSVQATVIGETAIGSGAFKLVSRLGGVTQDLSETATFTSATLFRRGLNIRDDAELDALVTTAVSNLEIELTFFLHDLQAS